MTHIIVKLNGQFGDNYLNISSKFNKIRLKTEVENYYKMTRQLPE